MVFNRERYSSQMPLIIAMILIGLCFLLYTPFLQPVYDGDFYMVETLKSHVIPVPLISALVGVTLLVGAALLALLGKHHTAALIIIITTGIVLRLLFSFSYLGGFDMNYYFMWPQMIGNGESLYGGIWDPKGPPLQPFVVYYGALIANVTKLPLNGIVGVFCAIADLGTTLLIYKIAKRESQPASMQLMASALFILNPITVIIAGIHKHLGTSAYILATVGAYALLHYKQQHRWSGLVMGIGIAFRHLPLMFIPAFLAHCKTWRDRLEFFVLAGLPSLLLFIPELLKNPLTVIQSVSGYAGVGRWWGTAMLMEEISNNIFHGYGNEEIAFVERIGGIVMLLLFCVLAVVLFHKIPLLESLIIITLIFYLNPMGFSTQYPFILVPFLALDFKRSSIVWYTVLAGIFVFMTYLAFFYPPLDQPIRYIEWVTVVVAAWCLVDLVQRLYHLLRPDQPTALTSPSQSEAHP